MSTRVLHQDHTKETPAYRVGGLEDGLTLRLEADLLSPDARVRLWAKNEVACPCCDSTTRIAYDIFSDECTCYHCGLIDVIGDFRAHYQEVRLLQVMS